MAVEYASLRGTTDGMDLSVMTEIADYFENEIGYNIPANTPFVGRNFNATRAGIHADGLLKDEEIYNIFDTKTILNRPATVIVDATSGTAGIAFWINGFYKLKGENVIDKRHPAVIKLKELVDQEYANGRNTAMSAFELDTMLLNIDPDVHTALEHHHLKKI
jgi:isopropylmalate/homocitrate/citramalate synthase